MSTFSFKESTVCKKAFSSGNVFANLAEANRKKRHPKNFISKLTDCDAENSGTELWLDFALACQYINEEIKSILQNKSEETGKILYHTINNIEKN